MNAVAIAALSYVIAGEVHAPPVPICPRPTGGPLWSMRASTTATRGAGEPSSSTARGSVVRGAIAPAAKGAIGPDLSDVGGKYERAVLVESVLECEIKVDSRTCASKPIAAVRGLAARALPFNSRHRRPPYRAFRSAFSRMDRLTAIDSASDGPPRRGWVLKDRSVPFHLHRGNGNEPPDFSP